MKIFRQIKSLLKTQDDCKTGPAMDEHTLIDSLKALQTGWKEKAPLKKWDISMEISAKQDNIYMGTKTVKNLKINASKCETKLSRTWH